MPAVLTTVLPLPPIRAWNPPLAMPPVRVSVLPPVDATMNESLASVTGPANVRSVLSPVTSKAPLPLVPVPLIVTGSVALSARMLSWPPDWTTVLPVTGVAFPSALVSVTINWPAETTTWPANPVDAPPRVSAPAPPLVNVVNPNRAPAVVVAVVLRVAAPAPDRLPTVTTAPPAP